MPTKLVKSNGFKCRPGCHDCCTLPPLKKDFLLKNKHLVLKKVDVVEMLGHCFVMTDNQMCPFLQDGICVVYSTRPKICRQYGRVKSMPCIYFTPTGRERTQAEQNRVKAEYDEKRLKVKMIYKDILR
jgi:Fe-S-cluster containining protein